MLGAVYPIEMLDFPPFFMKAHECYHCRQWVEKDEPHDCWTTTEAALTRNLSEDLRDAWERLRETAVEFGEQRIYASHSSIMFSRKACYFFVRPRTKVLELCVFLGRTLTSPQVKKAVASSRVKVAHLIHVKHRDEVEAPLTDWLREAYDVSPTLGAVLREPVRKKKTARANTARTPKARAVRAKKSATARTTRKV